MKRHNNRKRAKRHDLHRSLMSLNLNMDIGPKRIDRNVQKIVYLINLYCRMKFGTDRFPEQLIVMRDEIEISFPNIIKKYDFRQLIYQAVDDVEDEIIMTNMYLSRFGPEKYKKAVRDLNRLIPYVVDPNDLPRPKTPITALSPMSSLSSDSNESAEKHTDEGNEDGNASTSVMGSEQIQSQGFNDEDANVMGVEIATVDDVEDGDVSIHSSNTEEFQMVAGSMVASTETATETNRKAEDN